MQAADNNPRAAGVRALTCGALGPLCPEVQEPSTGTSQDPGIRQPGRDLQKQEVRDGPARSKAQDGRGLRNQGRQALRADN